MTKYGAMLIFNFVALVQKVGATEWSPYSLDAIENTGMQDRGAAHDYVPTGVGHEFRQQLLKSSLMGGAKTPSADAVLSPKWVNGHLKGWQVSQAASTRKTTPPEPYKPAQVVVEPFLEELTIAPSSNSALAPHWVDGHLKGFQWHHPDAEQRAPPQQQMMPSETNSLQDDATNHQSSQEYEQVTQHHDNTLVMPDDLAQKATKTAKEQPIQQEAPQRFSNALLPKQDDQISTQLAPNVQQGKMEINQATAQDADQRRMHAAATDPPVDAPKQEPGKEERAQQVIQEALQRPAQHKQLSEAKPREFGWASPEHFQQSQQVQKNADEQNGAPQGWTQDKQISAQQASPQIIVQNTPPRPVPRNPMLWRERWRQRYEQKRQRNQLQMRQPSGLSGWHTPSEPSLVRSDENPRRNIGPVTDGHVYAQSLLEIGEVAGPESSASELLAEPFVDDDLESSIYAHGRTRSQPSMETKSISSLQDALAKSEIQDLAETGVFKDSAASLFAGAGIDSDPDRLNSVKALMRSAKTSKRERVPAVASDALDQVDQFQSVGAAGNLISGMGSRSELDRSEGYKDVMRPASDRLAHAGLFGEVRGRASAAATDSLDSLKRRLQKFKHWKSGKHGSEVAASEDSNDDAIAHDQQEQDQRDSWWNQKESWWKKQLQNIQKEDDLDSDR